ncbi:hypothetical protein CHS0354_030602 [Potamilus streckersoni]|uniref:Uncharacterized protein n=1 Tax=Potamilus streckersoni TaxID=2493646 RepID=A0AAE0SDG9_9BIVA|nr:hypothetical protein CHS0354_030602 [Potamilus streckersoni]
MFVNGSLDVNVWREVITKYLGKGAGKKFISIMINIMVVDEGLKPSYLYDSGVADADMLLGLVTELYNSQQIKNQLKIFKVCEDLFIAKLVSLECHYEQLVDRLQYCLVDISMHGSPQICEDPNVVVHVLSELNKLLGMCRENGNTLSEFYPSCNVTTVYGILLGYPVIYWYNEKDITGRTGDLSMEKLIVVNISGFVQTKGDITLKETLYSFSFPSCLRNKLEPLVQQWYQALLKELGTRDSPLCELKVSLAEKEFPALCL